jgi:subtilase family serine protease
LLEFDGYYAGDITTYHTQTGLPNVPLQVVLLAGFDGNPTTGPDSGNGEVALDIEMASSMAPGLAGIVLYEAGPNGTGNDVLASMSANPDIKQFSCSWGFGALSSADQATMDNYFMKMNAQGQTFLDASGDTGALSGPVEPPGDDPYITQVGGTALAAAAPGGPWLSETVRNAQEGPGFNISSGGVSTTYPIPSWQQGVDMSANGGSTTMRNIPDVAAVADNIFLVADDGQLETSGGTSAAAPLWAGFIAPANQAAAEAGLPSVGFINPALYTIGASAGYTASFDDITIGNNFNTVPGQFSAVPGYDLCTGWGSPIGGPLIIALVQPDGFLVTPGRGHVANGPAAGPFNIPSQTFTLANAGAASLNWSLATTSSWLNVSSSQGSIAPGESASITVTLNAVANLFPGGVYTNQLWFTNLTSGLGQLRQFTLQIGQNIVTDGGFEAGDFSYWYLGGDPSIYDNTTRTAG